MRVGRSSRNDWIDNDQARTPGNSNRGLQRRNVFGWIEVAPLFSATHLASKEDAAEISVRDGDVLELGNVSVQVLHTPGHTPEHISLVVTDRTRADEPWFVLTGHTLMVGDLGRTELATSAEEGARALFRSVQSLKALPDYLEILPGAYSGSVCGRSLSGKPTSTIGFEKRHNKAFRIDDEDAFVRAMVADIPPPPTQAAQIRAVNSGTVAMAE